MVEIKIPRAFSIHIPQGVIVMRSASGFCILVLLLSIFINPCSLQAAWPPAGLLVCGETGAQEAVRIVTDGAGGAVVAWQDLRNPNRKIYAQRVDGSGVPYWTDGGIQVSGSGDHRLLEMVTDGENGAILMWLDSGIDVYAQRISGSGAIQWTSGGVHVVGGGLGQLVAVEDGAGGVIMVYVYASSGNHIYAQKLNSSGALMWDDPPGHVAVSTASSEEYDPMIAADGSGGVVIAFLSGRELFSESEIYAQRVFSSGSVWTANGVAVATGDVSRGEQVIACDGMGNSIIAWREGPGDPWILARRIDASGTLQWYSAAIICSEDDVQEAPDILADGSGGAYIVWADHRDSRDDIYAQRIDIMGNILWTTDGVPVCVDNGDQSHPRLLPCEAGFIAVWEDRRHYEHIYGQKVDIGGGCVWATDGVEVLEGIMDSGDWDFDADGAGGILAATVDDREMAALDIYAQSINCFGDVASPEPGILAVEDVPGDQGGYLRITIDPSDRDDNGQELEQVDHYDLWQRIDETAASLPFKSALAIPSDRTVLSNMSAFHLAQIVESETGRYMLMAPSAVQPRGTWEFIGSFDATQSGEYTYRATTVADSSDAGIPYCVYVVSAHTVNPAVWFVSEPDSGYSIDNIPPGAPEGFSVAYNTGSGNELEWDESPAEDFDYFRIYRGESDDFIPSEENLVQTTTGTDWLDDIEDGYLYSYKITAVDHNGNESDAASPESVTGDDTPAVPQRFALYQNTPNPFNPATMIIFDLPRAAHVKLSVFNVKGELVSTPVDRRMSEGRKEVTWLAEDSGGRPLSSGIYLYRLVAGDFVKTRKMVLLR